MNPKIVKCWLCLAGLLLGGAALADAPGPCEITSNTQDDGSVALSNTESAAGCETPATAPAAVKVPAAAPNAEAELPPEALAPDAAGDPPKDPRQQYRDAMLLGTPGTTAENPSVSRRYKMMNKQTYQATVLGGGHPAAQGAGASPQ